MAGVKGRSGGARPGAGRKRKEPQSVSLEAAQVVHGEALDPRPTLELIALGHMEVGAQQYKALVALLPYVHVKKGDGGKKDEKADRAKQAAGGKYAAAGPPLKLVRRA